MTEELKPCPFCGSRAVKIYVVGTSLFWAQCECDTAGPDRSTKAAALSAWNRRADAVACRSGAEAMKAQVVDLIRQHSTAPDGLIYAENAEAVIRGYNMAGQHILARVEALPIPGAEP